MRLTIKRKLVIAIAIVISIIMTIGLVGIYYVVDNSEEEYIKEDIDVISDFSKNYIYTSKVLDDNKDSFNIINTINELFNVYVYLDLENESLSTGKILVENDISELKLEEDNTISKLKLYTKDKLASGTLYQPIYIDGEYYGRLIIQKDYSSIHMLNQSILFSIGIILCIVVLILITLVYLIVKKSTKPLEDLTVAIKSFGKGEKTQSLQVKANDEIGDLTTEFNYMKDNISHLQDTSKEFFNNATHELKTPLTVIKGYAQLLQEEEFKNSDISEMIDNIECETIKMSNLINKLLTLSKEEARLSREKEEINVRYIVEDLLQVFRVIIEEKQYNMNLEIEDVIIKGIKEEIITLISNLIDNAIKYSDGQDINIILSDKGKLVISNKCTSIRDNIKNNLFEAFIKGNTYKHVNSSGLGLYMCKNIANSNNLKLSYSIDKDLIIFILDFNI
ncbi:MAG: HAMP domain-containing sensor histidine kinase [Clostridium sp.]